MATSPSEGRQPELIARVNRIAARYLGLVYAWSFLGGVIFAAAFILVGGEKRWLYLILAGGLLGAAALDSVRVRRHPCEAELRERRLGEYWWLGTAVPLGVGTWATFVYLAIRLRRPAWAGYAAVYLLALVSAGAVNAIGRDSELSALSAGIYLATWVAGITHAFLIRNDVRASLNRLALAPAASR